MQQTYLSNNLWHAIRALEQGLRPATRQVMEDVLGSGGSVLLCPGGVQVDGWECWDFYVLDLGPRPHKVDPCLLMSVEEIYTTHFLHLWGNIMNRT
jgi:hypothetical protein